MSKQSVAAFLLAISLTLSGSLHATETGGTTQLSLQTAIKQTLKNNPQLHQFRYARDRLSAEQELGALRPQWSVNLEAENFAGSGDFNSFDNAELTIALSSVIELGGKRGSRIAVASNRLQTFEMQQQATTLDVLGELTAAFVMVLTTQAEQKLADEAVRLSEELLATVSNRAERGAASDAEVKRANAMLTQSRIQQFSLQQKLERQKNTLVRFWGATEPAFDHLNGDLFSFGSSRSFEELYSQVEQSPAIEVFASEARLRDAEIKLARSQSRADLSWAFGARRFEDTNDSALVLGFSVPLFAARRNTAAINAATADRNAVDWQRTNRLLLLRDRLFTAYSQRQQFIKTHELLSQEVVPELEQALTITRNAYDRGRLRYQDWIAAQQELLSAKQQLIGTANGVLLNQAVIEQLTAVPLTK